MHNRNTIIPIYHKMPKYVDRIREIYKRYAIDIADPRSKQDACHMNFAIDLAHLGVSMAQC